MESAPAAVIFDLDGVLIDSEVVWSEARRALVEQSGGAWTDAAQAAMMGMSSGEWSRYMRDELGVALSSEDISARVVAMLRRRYREHLPLIPGARAVVVELAQRWRLGLASSANREIIDLVLREAELSACFHATVSSEEVALGKPAPDVYLAAASRLSSDPERCVAVEDSANGLRAAAAAGMRLVAIPNEAFPPGPDALGLADVVLDSIRALKPPLLARLGGEQGRRPSRGFRY